MSVDRLIIPGYTVLDVLHRGQTRVVYRAREEASETPVIVKTSGDGVQPALAEAALEREAEVLQRLIVDGVPRLVALELRGSRPALILEDLGGDTMSAVIGANTLGLKQRLHVARHLAEVLARIHKLGVVHRDINPSNVLVDTATLRGGIIDFGLADPGHSVERALGAVERAPGAVERASGAVEQASGAAEGAPGAAMIEGTPAYLAPEQSGRTGWEVDHRSDLYSLGATLFEFFTGRLPFDSQDPLKVVHAHMALQPVAPEVLDPAIPPVLGAMILKLMAKLPGERYQSATGLVADLTRIIEQLDETGQVLLFDLGVQDFSEHLAMPQRLYGREEDLARLTAAFERSRVDRGEVVLVAGYSGVGKTSLVRELAGSVAQTATPGL